MLNCGSLIRRYLMHMGRKSRSPEGPQLDRLAMLAVPHEYVDPDTITAWPRGKQQQAWREEEDGDSEVDVGAVSTALKAIHSEHQDVLLEQYGDRGARWQQLARPEEGDSRAQEKLKKLYAIHADMGALYKFTPSGRAALEDMRKKERGAKLGVSEDKKLQNAVVMPAVGIQNKLDRAREEATIKLIAAEHAFAEAYRKAEAEQLLREQAAIAWSAAASTRK
jgi:hypothetical protein